MSALQLPNRTTRGNRYKSLLTKEELEEEQAEDKDFWKQEFFQEEAKDDAYNTESEPSDVFSSDFDNTEDDDDDDGENEDGDNHREKKRPVLKPPGHKKLARMKQANRVAIKAKVARESQPKVGLHGSDNVEVANLEAGNQQHATYEAPSLRRSTRERVAEAEEERRVKEKTVVKRKRVTQGNEQRILTQEELLAEAAQTEIENTKSLQLLMAYEQETKRQANLEQQGYVGPRLKYHSRIVDGELQTTWTPMDCDSTCAATSYELARHTAAAPPPPQVCIITGQTARFRDPSCGMPYADAHAFKELRRRLSAGTLILQPRAAKLAALGH